MNEIISAMLYVMMATLAYACFYVSESFKKALVAFLFFGIWLCFRYFWYSVFTSVFLFAYLSEWFYPGLLASYAVGGALGLVYFCRERSRIQQLEATHRREEINSE